MLPEDNPADAYEHYQCDICGGSIMQNREDLNLWECDNCDCKFISKGKERE